MFKPTDGIVASSLSRDCSCCAEEDDDEEEGPCPRCAAAAAAAGAAAGAATGGRLGGMPLKYFYAGSPQILTNHRIV